MKHFYLILTVVFAFISSLLNAQLPYLYYQDGDTLVNETKYREWLNNHPYVLRKPMLKADVKKMDKKDRPDLAYEHDWKMTHDPKTGKVEWNRLIPIINRLHTGNQVLTAAPGASSANSWQERGPNNVGGRVRAMMFDPTDNTNKKVYAGGVGGGLWYNNDITSSSSSWTAVNDFWSNIAVSCIAHHPTSTSTWYVGTGEGYRNADAIRGGGIWKTTNAGTTWTQLTATNPSTNSAFRYVMDLVVTSTGRIVAATYGGIYTSDNGGTSWTRRQTGAMGDVELASNGDLYVGNRSSGNLFKSTNNGTSWTNLTSVGTGGRRIEIACAPSDSNTLYVVASGGSGDRDTEYLKKSTNGGTTWSTLSIPTYAIDATKHFTRRQAWYDLILWVHPTNANIVIAGGVDLHRTTNGGSSWSPISFWYNTLGLPVVHADQHMILSRPGNNNEIIVGNDGGVYYSSNAGNSSVSRPTYGHRVKNFNVTQYYSAAMHPGAGSDTLLAGSQDNGSHRTITAGVGPWVEVTGGDGAFCFIDQNNPNVFITSYVYNNWRISRNGGGAFSRYSDNTGRFINPADYDDNLNILYAAKSSSTLKRISNVGNLSPTFTDINVGSLGSSSASHIRVSPYTTGSSTLFVGANSDVYKITNANSTPTSTKITPISFPNEYISCVEIGASENELLVTFSSYGGTEVYYTSNGGTTWVDKSGNLPDMPIRWALFNPKNRKEVILATEVGVWATSDFSVANPVWTASNSGLANTRVDMLQYRASDSLIMASTHGRGAFTGRFKSATTVTPPAASFTASKTSICVGESVTYKSTSTGNPTSQLWTITGGIPSTSTADSVVVNYSTAGTKSVKLKVSNAGGADSLTQMLVTVNAKPTVSLSAIGPFCTTDPAITLSQGIPTGGTYSGSGVSSGMFNPATAGAGTHTIKYVFTNSNGCSDSATTTVSVTSGATATATSVPNQCTNTAAFALTNGAPSGGVYSGTGVSSGMFNPSMAGGGIHTIKYKVGTGTCADSTTFTIQVDSAPVVSLGAIGSFCTSDPAVSLTQGSPMGGTYSGPGVSSGMFNPATAGAGTHTVKYVYTNSNGCSDSTTTTVSVTSAATATATSVPNQCTNTATFALTNGAPAGGVYSGTGVSSGMFNPSMAGAGTHTIKYKVGTGTCADSTTFTIQVDSAPVVSLSAIGPFCSSDPSQTLTQGIPSGGNYSGPGVTGLTFSPSTAGVGTHTIKYVFTNSSGCMDSATTQVVVGTGITPTLGSFSDKCANDTSFTLTGGMPSGGTYSGIGVSAGQFHPAIAGAGTHTIFYTHPNACGGAQASSTIKVKGLPNIVASADTAICAGASAMLSASGAAVYAWSPTSSLTGASTATPTATPNNTTTYLVIGIDSGCAGVDSVTVAVNALPNVSAGTDQTICSGDTTKLLATGASSYVWSPTTGLSASNVANPSVSLTNSQTYVVTGTDANGCENSDSVSITVIQGPSVSLNSFNDVCVSAAPFKLSGGSPAGGFYTGTGVNKGEFNPAKAGIGTHTITYWVKGTKCTSKATATITVVGAPKITWNTPLSYCENDAAVTPQATPTGGTFSGSAINNGQISPASLGAGNYNLTYEVTDSTGCTGKESKEVVVHKADSVSNINGVIHAIINHTYNYNVNAVNGASYTWTIQGGAIQSTNSNSITVKWSNGSKGVLKVIQTNSNGCVDSTELELGINPLSDKEFALQNGTVRVFPNPAKTVLNIEINSEQAKENVEVQLINANGKVIQKQLINYPEGKSTTELEVNEVEVGLYFLVIPQDNEPKYIPVVVSR